MARNNEDVEKEAVLAFGINLGTHPGVRLARNNRTGKLQAYCSDMKCHVVCTHEEDGFHCFTQYPHPVEDYD